MPQINPKPASSGETYSTPGRIGHLVLTSEIHGRAERQIITHPASFNAVWMQVAELRTVELS